LAPILLHCPPCLLPQAQPVVKSQYYGCGCVGITPEMVFGFASLSALRLAGCRSVLVELQLAPKLILVPTLCPHPFSHR
jgi:hypothetical protein